MIKKILQLAGWVALMLAIALFINFVVARPLQAQEFLFPSENQCVNCRMSETGLTVLKNLEGFSPFIYLDSAGLRTICWGHLVKKGEHFNEPMLGDSCVPFLRNDVSTADQAVNRQTGYKRKQNQHDALASFFFNLGEKKVVSGKGTIDAIRHAKHKTIPDKIREWVYAANKKVRGLVIRREVEAILYSR
jgi:lysozyme